MRLNATHARKVERIMFDESILDEMSDDHSDEALREAGPHYSINAVKTLLHMRSHYFLQPKENILFMLTPRTNTLYEVHTMVLPGSRGISAVKATREAALWMFENSTCEKIVTYVPFINKKAMVFAKIVGMKEEGICTKSFKKNGILHDQWVLGLEKEVISCQQ